MSAKMRVDHLRGSVYATVLIISVTLGVAAVALSTFGTARSRYSDVAVAERRTKSLLEGATQMAAVALVNFIASLNTGDDLDPGNSWDPNITIDGTYIPCAVKRAPVDEETEINPTTGLLEIRTQFEISARLISPEGTPTAVTTLVNIYSVPLFQFGVFYDGDLEIVPGPAMTISGRVHTNSDLYVGTNDTKGGGLSFETDYLRAAGQMFRRRKDNDKDFTGKTQVQDLAGIYQTWPNSDYDSDASDWYQKALETWGGTVKSDVHGVVPLELPPIGAIEPGGYYNTEASVGGVVINDGRIFVGGVDVTEKAPPGVVSSINTWDAREGATVQLWSVDMSLLKTFIDANLGSTFNGLLYMTQPTTADQPDGFQLTKGAELPAGGLTVVTNTPLYIKGDYNKTDKKPAAVIADAVNLLSNAWNNTKKSGSGLPNAADTTYNAAFVAGIVPTPDGGGPYSGGLENFFRYHEDWADKDGTDGGRKTMFGEGSCVNLYKSQYADGEWKYGGNRYTAPNRIWSYDTDFNDLAGQPPYAPQGVSAGVVLAGLESN